MRSVVLSFVLAACPGLPPQDITPGGYWPESCRGNTTYLGLCQGMCNTTDGYTGSPNVQCIQGTDGTPRWSGTLVGACRKGVAGEPRGWPALPPRLVQHACLTLAKAVGCVQSLSLNGHSSHRRLVQQTRVWCVVLCAFEQLGSGAKEQVFYPLLACLFV